MNRDDIRKLVGGYATGTLTDAERALLFEAALDDQDLFDELADEHALKELLEEPGVRQRLVDSLAPHNAKLPLKWWMRPWPVSAMGVVALAMLVMVAVLRTPETRQIALAPPPAPAADALAREASPPAPPSAPSRNSAAPAPPPAKGAPQSVGALAPAEEALKKDAGTAAPAPEPRKGESPTRANESDRKEQVLADAVQQQGGQQAQAAAQSQAPPPPPQQQTTFAQQATQSLAEAEQRRDQVAAGALGNPPAPRPAAQAKPSLARQAAPAVAAMVQANAALPAFTWIIENGVLRVTPARDGALRIQAAPRGELVVANARRGIVAEFAIPAEAASVRVVFSAPNISEDERSRAVNQRAASGAAGSVFMPAGSPNGAVSIEIPLK